jgi:hypothetical protein
MTGPDRRIVEFYDRYVHEQGAAVPAYGFVYFGHLHAEYQSIRPSINDQESLRLLDKIHEQWEKKHPPLTWNDIYAFDLVLTKFLPPERLLHKAYELRERYGSVVGNREHSSYLATSPQT